MTTDDQTTDDLWDDITTELLRNPWEGIDPEGQEMLQHLKEKSE